MPASEDGATPRAIALRAELFGQDFTVSEVAHILDCDRTTVLLYIRTHRLKAIKVGRTWHIPEASIREMRERAIADARAPRTTQEEE